MTEKTVKRHTLDDALKELGVYGRFHLYNYLLVFIAVAAIAVYAINYIFLAGDVPYRCRIEECESRNTTIYAPPWLSSAVPTSGEEARCSRYTREDTNFPCNASSFSKHMEECHSWIYSSKETIVSEFDLACKSWKRTLVGTIHNVGMLISLPIFGFISDKYGRKVSLSLGSSLVGIVGTLKAFSINYEMYISVEFLESVVGASIFPAGYIMIVELVGQKKRVQIASFLGIALVLGDVTMAITFKSIQYWRTWILTVYPPSILFICYFFILPESMRWLLSQGRKEEALKIIIKAGRWNKVELSKELLMDLESTDVSTTEKSEVVVENSVFKDVLKSPIIMYRIGVCSFFFITCTFVFYGLSINSVSLAGDKYNNFILVASVEIISCLLNIYFLDYVGRKFTLLMSFTLCGIVCIAIPFTPKTMAWLTVTLYLLGKVTITMAFGGIYMYTSELFPTHARQSLMGFCSMLGRIGSIVAPQMPLLMIYMESLPSLLFGGFALISAVLMTTTPETLNVKLPDTIQEAEEMSNANGMCFRNKSKTSYDLKVEDATCTQNDEGTKENNC